MNNQSLVKKQRNADGGQIAPFANPKRRKKRNKQQQKTSPNMPKPQAKRPDTLSLNMTKAKQLWEAEMERLNSKYNLDCFSDSELDSESDKGEQNHYEHGYETLI